MGHMQRYTYSATGALRWKRDVTEYADWARSLRAPLLDDRFQELQVPTRQHSGTYAHNISGHCACTQHTLLSRAVDEAMITWSQALGNVLVVAPAALLGLVEGSLRISHSAALKFIRLREDFKSARLPGGVSLAQAFADE